MQDDYHGYGAIMTFASTTPSAPLQAAGTFDFAVKHVIITNTGAMNSLEFRTVSTADALLVAPGVTQQLDLNAKGFTVAADASTTTFSISGLG